ncbi:hypothetical protein GVY41_18965 [Frigidibacter albus]|uniref:Uncharacterized protein n=1 Tax=Frigidibacter albus TaxID=1465486 RepID=A0A6L8VLA7_9RHOB|nr:hypothetical protein [Frigidibacter albus]MZQ91157.1 hypothetical protein [Frigidibacter albus]NBE33083.1 hypothetical protein [Frigidibacter albus]GGH63176.1 hypothetical protein GCM10011341_38070 [Frigidibacter albus]
MMTVDNLHRQAKVTADDIFEHTLSVVSGEFDVKRGTADFRKLAVELAPVIAAIMNVTATDLRTMLEHQRAESELEFRRSQLDD